jgi:hypothetical protein
MASAYLGEEILETNYKEIPANVQTISIVEFIHIRCIPEKLEYILSFSLLTAACMLNSKHQTSRI